VLDAKTGATVARVPVGGGQDRVAFSPDGSRAVVYGFVTQGSYAAREFRTRDFAPTRAITATDSHGTPAEIGAVFYGGPARSLYAMIYDSWSEPGGIAVVRVRDAGAPAEPPALRTSGIAIVVSPDGRLAFVLRSIEMDADSNLTAATIDVFDVRALAMRNTIALTGELAEDFMERIVPSFDGSELYLLGDVSRVRVLDSSTGSEVRQIATGWEQKRGLFLDNLCSGGHALLIVAGSDPCVMPAPEGAWWVSGSVARRAPEVATAVDTGTARYGVVDGTRLYRFGAGRRLVREAAIAQPSLPDGQTIWSLAMAASPNGSRLVLFASYGELVCPC
jgi:hypothetical protein